MSDLFYNTLVCLGRHPFWLNSRPVVIGAEHTHRQGAFIVASTHQSPYDIPILMRHTKRNLDFVSIVEVFEKPLLAWLYGNMNAFPLDRSKPDAPTVRTILDRLDRGRVICMFPEGGFRRGEQSVVHSRKIRTGIGRIAEMAKVPIVPCVIIGADQYSRFKSWLPLRRTRYGIIYGEPIMPGAEPLDIEAKLIDSLVELHRVLAAAM